ncbi:unnamed protein product [Didymodactylos carnosus]|uniref:beta-N-acetylhexosaminidase n=1 Tax=Didymodactylos carnosus TaxID=1234261 RepID=A0A813P9J1_9BILA|nr:unnamed protein product [Didymodactylos carnosus]CAF1289751.1 unnamed protein product [Didymodactylos carnosus]CAF3531148.1 unnamed protein product [Didymodactylos carnosus]CAF4094601.1 unnamed protein product [Didymodactylos carnosus]
MFSRRQLRRSVLAVCSLSVLFVICLTVFRENILPSKSIAADETSYLQKTTNLHSRHHHHHDQNYQHTKKRNKSQYSVLKPNRMFIDIERNRANLLLLPPTTQIPQSVDQVNNQLPLGQQVAQSQNISLKSFRGVIQRHQLHNENQLLKSNHIINVDTFEQYQPHHSQLQYRQRPQIIPSSDEYQPPLPKVDIINTTNLERFIHLDLKGAAPKINYFKQLFPLLKQLGATGLLIEYEDMFPFKGKLKSIVHGKHYTETDIQQLLETAKENNLKVMPLLQTYGHLEYVLKLKEFMHLREDVRYPQVITPCLKESYTVLFDMLDQMLNLHPDIDYLHLGCDEVYYRLVHPACLKLNFKDESDLFIRNKYNNSFS